jgi:hypothetical protein
VGAQAAQQFHRFQQVGLALPVRPHHQQPRCLQAEIQPLDVAELLQVEKLQPDGPGAMSG